jgi:hypothetical protein
VITSQGVSNRILPTILFSPLKLNVQPVLTSLTCMNNEVPCVLSRVLLIPFQFIEILFMLPYS